MTNYVTSSSPFRLTAQEAAHAMPVLQSVHPALRAAPAPRLAAMRTLAARSGVKDGALRTALSRACAAGSLEAPRGGYRLGPLSRAEAADARALMARVPGYVLAIMPEGAGGDLAALRELFQRLGLRPLQRSVWIGARTRDDRLGAALDRAGLAGAALVFQADEAEAPVRERLSALWGLAGRAAELEAFRARLTAWLAEPGVGGREAAWRCVEAAPVWYRVAVREEPPFPLELLGPDYPLEALNAAWRERLEAAAPDLLDLWNEAAP